jgi:hypothetical protein
VGGRLLGRPALGEDQLTVLGGDAWPVVADPQDDGAALGAQLHLDRGAGRPGRRVQRVVEQVAGDRDQAARIDEPVRQRGGGGQAQGHRAFGGDRRLADQDRGEQRVPDLLGDLLRGGPVHSDDLGDELDGLLVQLQFEQAEQGVQPVGVLVVLGAQGVDQAARRVELAAQALQLGAVAEGGDGAPVVGRHPVGDEDAVTAHGQQVGALDPAGQHIGRTPGTEHLVQGPAPGLGADAEETLRLVVEQPDPAVAIERDHAFADGVQHGLALCKQPRNIGEGQVTGLLVDAPRDQIRGERAHRERAARVGEQAGDRVQEPRPDAVVLDADRDGADDPATGVPQRHLAPGRAAQGAAVDLHDVAAREGVGRVGGHDLADLSGVGVRPAHPAGVHDHHVFGPGRPPDALRVRLYRSLGGRPRGEQVVGDLGLGGRGRGDGERAPHGLVVELGAERGQEEPGREHGDSGGDGQLHEQHLGEHAPRPAKPPPARGGPGGRGGHGQAR